MNPWKSRATFLSRNCITRKLGKDEQEVDFYAVSPQMVFKLRSISRPLAHALTYFFSDKSNDSRRTMRDTNDTREGVTVSETIVDAVDAEVLRERSAKQEVAIDRLIEACSEQRNYLLLLEIIWDSMRGIFGQKPPSDQELEDLAADPDIDIPTVIDMLKGVAAANFESLSEWMGKRGEALAQKIGIEEQQKTPASDPAPTSPESTPMSSPTESASPLRPVAPPPGC